MRSMAEILRRTYRDKLTVVRGSPGVDDSGESVWEETAAYDSIPCALSLKSTGLPKREGSRRVSDTEHVIFAAPDIRMEDMDKVTVVTEAGQVFRGRSGRTYVYAGSHGETPLYIEEMA